MNVIKSNVKGEKSLNHRQTTVSIAWPTVPLIICLAKSLAQSLALNQLHS